MHLVFYLGIVNNTLYIFNNDQNVPFVLKIQGLLQYI